MKTLLITLLLSISIFGQSDAFKLLILLDSDDGEWYEEYTPFIAGVNTTNNPTITVAGEAGDSMFVDWGDGQTEVVNFTGADQNITNTYSSAIVTEIKFYGNMTKFSTASNMAWSFDIGDLPSTLTYYANTGSNTTSGSIASLPSGLTVYINQGLNTTSGDIGSLPSDLTYYRNEGLNTTSGSIASLPSDLTYYRNSGSNTTSGSIASLPSKLAYYNNQGLNTVSDYSGKTWTTKPATFLSAGQSGLSTAEVDQLLIDFNDDLVWSAGNAITLTGNCQPRSSASNAAVANMNSEGATIITNP